MFSKRGLLEETMRISVVCGAMLCFAGLASASTCGTVGGTVLDLTTAGASGFINLAFFQQIPDQSTGTGVIDPFVRLSTNDSCEQGYGTTGRPLPFDENSSPTFTHDLLLSNVPTVTVGGIQYLQFLLDINQTSANPLLSLEQIRIYQSNTAGVKSTNLADLGTLVYNLDGAGDRYIKLDYSLNSGSGSGDMFAYIPKNLFDLTKTNIYFFSEFGEHFNQNDGFEEWATLTPSAPVPEPVSSTLIGTGLVALFFLRRRATR